MDRRKMLIALAMYSGKGHVHIQKRWFEIDGIAFKPALANQFRCVFFVKANKTWSDSSKRNASQLKMSLALIEDHQ
jgi:hypothetical protein